MDNDRISRQAAIDVIKTSRCLVNALKKTMKLPSAQQEPKTAHWIPLDERFASWSDYFKCSECGFRIKLRAVTDFGGKSVNYCPHCKSKMEVKNG
jgi:DNA-directed RNA polymerase subunit RPC12/RpoP